MKVAPGQIATPPTVTAKKVLYGDLLRFRPARDLLESALYPLVLQLPLLLAFALILAFAFFGTIRGGQNLATVATWGLWWPLLPASLLLFGRIWCTVCPLATVAGYLQRWWLGKAQAPLWLRRYGVWFMGLSFLLLTWMDRVWNITGSPRATGVMLLALLLGATITSALYQRRVWCRYLCPIGALTGLYAMASVIELNAQPEKCHNCRGKDCYVGNSRATGCPLFEFPATIASSRNCNLCANCIKACPHRSIQLRLRLPASELWRLRRPILGEAFLATLLVAVVYLQTIDMTFAWGDYMKWLLEETGLNDYNLAFTMTFVGTVVLGLGLILLAVWASSHLEHASLRANFARFGYTYLPLALAGHLGHNLSHLAGEGSRSIQVVLDQLRLPFVLFPMAELPEARVIAADPLGLGIVALGGLGSLYAAWRQGAEASSSPSKQRHSTPIVISLPHLVLLLVLTGLYLYMFLLPMNPRHAH